MEAFLDALSPSVRKKTEEALALENGEARLERIASRYIDDEGKWPIERMTADYIARSFIAESEVAAAAFSPYGLKGPTIAALSTGAITMGQGKTIIALGSKLVGKYWVEMATYALGINPAVGLAISGVIHHATTVADWAGISRGMENGFDEDLWQEEFSNDYAKSFERATLGPLAQSAWRGSRSAANHIETKRVGDVSVNQWVQDYVAKVAQAQVDLSVRTARHIVENSLELPSNVMAGRLEQMWALTPHHVDSVNRYRAGLARADHTASWVNKRTKSYADRLLKQRLDTLTKTEAQTVFNLGREIQWVRSVKEGTLPADTMKMWITGQDEKVCEVCEPMDGKTTPLGEVFDTIDLYVPSAHPNCRCIVVPVQPAVANADAPQLVFPVRDVVEKHLGGPSGTDDHPSGTPQSVHSIGREMHELGKTLNALGEDTFFSRKKMADVLGSESAADELFDEIVAFTSNMNSVKELRDSSKRLRDLVLAAPRVDKTLYRGEALYTSPEEADEALKKGTIISRELTSFTENEDIARVFDGKRLGREGQSVSVRMSLAPGARGVHVEPVTNSNGRRARGLGEYLVSGNFEVVSARRDGNVMDVEIRPLDGVSKRTVTVEEYTRADGTVVQEHDRTLTPYNGYENPEKVVEAVREISRGELSLEPQRTPFGNKKDPRGYEKGDDSVYFYFDVKKDEDDVGVLVFTVHKDKTAHLDWFMLEKEYQQSGFGRSVFDVGLEALRTAGVEKAHLEANIDVGGYAWAVMGVGFDPDPAMGKPGLQEKSLQRRLNYFKEHGYAYYGIVGRAKNWYGRQFNDKKSPYTAKQRTQINREIDKLVERSDKYPVGHAKSPTPQDLAALGREHRWTHEDGFSMWPGKEILLGSSWDGVLDLTQVSKSIGNTETTLAWLDGITPIDITLDGKTDYPLHRGLVTPKPEDEDRLYDEVSKRTILIPEYEREDGTTVRRHTRVIGERDAMERWKDAKPTEEHKRLAKAFNKISHDFDVELPERPKSWKNPSDFDNDFKAFHKFVQGWYDTAEGKKWAQDLWVAERKARVKVDQDAQEKIREDVADHELVKSAIRGSRIWTTSQGGQGLVRELAGVTTPGHISSSEYTGRSWRESEIKAVSDFINVVRSAPHQNTRVFYRGIGIPGPGEKNFSDYEELRNQLNVGSVIDLPVSSLSEKEYIARDFMGIGIPEEKNHQVLFRFEKGARAVRLPDPVSNPLFQEREWVTSGKYRVSRVEDVQPSRNYRHDGVKPQGYTMVSLEYAGDTAVSKSKADLLDEIVDRLCTPLPRLEQLYGDVSKRTITVDEYTRRDGTVVEEHEREIDPAKAVSNVLDGFKDPRVRNFIEGYERDGELSFHEATALGTIAAFGIAFASRGRIRRELTTTIYDNMGTLPSGELVVPPKLMDSLRETYTYKSTSTGLRTEIKSVTVETAPHHTYMGQRLHEMMGGRADMPAALRGKQTLSGRVADRFLVKRDNIFVEARVLNQEGRTVGRFETTIDPRKREVFQDGFFMDSNYQGSGFSGEFTAHIGMRYVQTGIDSIGVFAGGPVGGYAWASRGFDWRYGPSKEVMGRLAEAQRKTDVYPEPVLKEIRDMRRRMLLGLSTGRFPKPQEISRIGQDYKRVEPGASTSATARQTWAGKDILLGSHWHASLNIREVRNLLRKEGVIKRLTFMVGSDEVSPRHTSTLSVGSRS